VNPLFQTHQLNAGGVVITKNVREDFDALLTNLEKLGALHGREGAIVKTKLEEACFFAIKAVCLFEGNQMPKPGEPT
jgi:hypothetical protein